MPRYKTQQRSTADKKHYGSLAMRLDVSEQGEAQTNKTDVLQIQLSRKLDTLLTDLRKPFTDYAMGFDTTLAKRAELAPKFMKTYESFQAETSRSFIDFVRLVDHHVPAARKEYKANRVYQAADYLRRVQSNKLKGKTRKAGPKPATPLEALARFIATLLPAMEGPVWQSLLSELHWSDRQAKRLQALARKEGPIDLAVKPAA